MGSEMEEKPVIKVVALCGSLRKASTNRGIIRAAMKMCTESEIQGMEMEELDLSKLPMLNVDLEVNGTYPPLVEEFRRKIREADAVFFATPDYNYSVTPILKNALDWASRPPNAWADKPAAVASVQASSRSGQYHLRQIGVFLDIHFINKPEFFVNSVLPPKKFDVNGDLIDEDLRQRLLEMLLALKAFTLRLIKGKSQ
ncbi:NAD(P)H:quinone oxidoreductase-like [Chenopodium quinoa]|uniref:NAD(P)H dehydrogenase (quinone) n=1 Tax=Chenopodium quinoa TaxID=63459 RepID=A0A803MMZ4_CHEQI|nr:NAD(P)H:quinone oxidoreductase-like [Chenopodium quinoa]